MKYKAMYTNLYRTKAYLLGLFILFGVSGCKKDNNETDGKTIMRVELVGTESDEGHSPLATKSGGNNAKDPQIVVLPFGDDMIVTATLEEVNRTGQPVSQPLVTKSGIKRNPLGEGVKYGLLVYNDQGELVAEQEYTHKDAGTQTEGISNLEVGKEYTCIAYSINSKDALPTLTSKGSLSTATAALTSDDLMIHKSNITITSGSNTLKVILKHKFTEILPTIAIQTNVTATNPILWGGVIHSVGTASFNSVCSQGGVNLVDGSYNWSTVTTNKNVDFPTITGNGVTALTANEPVLITNPSTTTGNFTINNLTVNDVTDNVNLSTLRIEPGKKYALKLNFNSPCIQQVDAKDFWISNHSVEQYSSWNDMPEADYGFNFDVHTLDNSFNMEVNGKPLIQTKRTYQYRTRSKNIFGSLSAWSDWVNVTNSANTLAINRTVSYNVSFPIFWDWKKGDLDFQHSAKAGEDFAIANIAFPDGQIYGYVAQNEGLGGNIPSIWDSGYWRTGYANDESEINPNGPVIRLIVSKSGDFKIFGKKTYNGAYEEMHIIPTQTSRIKYYLTNAIGANELQGTGGYPVVEPSNHLREERAILETRINPEVINWNSTGTNTVRVSQRIVNKTIMRVKGYGMKKVVCNP